MRDPAATSNSVDCKAGYRSRITRKIRNTSPSRSWAATRNTTVSFPIYKYNYTSDETISLKSYWKEWRRDNRMAGPGLACVTPIARSPYTGPCNQTITGCTGVYDDDYNRWNRWRQQHDRHHHHISSRAKRQMVLLPDVVVVVVVVKLKV